MAKALEEFLNVANSNTIRCTNQFEVFCTSVYSQIDKVLENATIYCQYRVRFSVIQRIRNGKHRSYKDDNGE